MILVNLLPPAQRAVAVELRLPGASDGRDGFAVWAGPCCEACGLPALLHGERCDDDEERR